MQREQLEQYRIRLTGSTPEAIIAWAASTFEPGRIALASSFGAEDQVLTHILAQISPRIEIFTLDTGRLFPETYELIEETRKRYSIDIQVLFPEREAVESMVAEHGVNLFYTSVELRRSCCGVRKVAPLRRKLATLDAWVTGLRRDQVASRADVSSLDWDEAHGIAKLNPLADWTIERVFTYLHEHRVPYSPLHDRGFPSIGCAPCTRAVAPGEDPRQGRWWWESATKECGLHWVDGRLVRARGTEED